MATSLPPPQAYTRDMLAAAYEWLGSQPPSIRELATNSDNLVALYLQARRRLTNNSANTNSRSPSTMTEVSSEAFKQDLRTLAEGMKQFDSTSSPMSRSHLPVPQQTVSQPMTQTTQQEIFNSVDSRTLELIRKVQSLCNLSSEREALRMLVAIGYERVLEVFPREK